MCVDDNDRRRPDGLSAWPRERLVKVQVGGWMLGTTPWELGWLRDRHTSGKGS